MTRTRRIGLGLLLAVAVLCLLGANTAQRIGDGRYHFERTGLTVPATLTGVYDLPVTQVPCVLALEVENTHASAAFTDFAVQANDYPVVSATTGLVIGEWYDVLSGTTWADSSIAKLDLCTNTATNPLPNTLAAGKRSHLWLVVKAPCSLRIAVSAASEITDALSVRGTIVEGKGPNG